MNWQELLHDWRFDFDARDYRCYRCLVLYHGPFDHACPGMKSGDRTGMKAIVSICAALAVLLLVGCSEGTRLTQPSPIETPAVPARITVTATIGIGTAAGQLYLAARVYDATGKGVNAAPVTFATSTGTVSPASALSDGLGLAQATVTTSAAVTVRVTSGEAQATLDVTPAAPITPIAPVDPIITPPPPPPPPSIPQPPAPPVPTPPPPAPIPPAGLEVTIGCTVAGSTAACNLSASYNSLPLLSAVTFTLVEYDWGDGQASTSAGPLASHLYTQAGSYVVTARVTAATVDGSRQALTRQGVTIK